MANHKETDWSLQKKNHTNSHIGNEIEEDERERATEFSIYMILNVRPSRILCRVCFCWLRHCSVVRVSRLHVCIAMGIQQPYRSKILYEQFKQSRMYSDVFIARIESKIYTMGVRLRVSQCASIYSFDIPKCISAACVCVCVCMSVNADNVNKIELCIFVCLHCIYCPSVQCQANGHNVAGFIRALASSSRFRFSSTFYTFNGNFRVLENFERKKDIQRQIVHCTARIPRWNAYRKEKHSHTRANTNSHT